MASRTARNFSVFDGVANDIDGDSKWCCAGPTRTLTVEFGTPVALTHFTLTSSGDTAHHDPRVFQIQASNNGTTWNTIFHWNAGTSPFSQRQEVIRFDGNGADFSIPAPYQWIRYNCITTGGGQHQINELEYFGVAVQVIHDFSCDKPLIPPNEPITLSWNLDPGIIAVSIDNDVGDVMAHTTNGVGSVPVNPGPGSTTTYTITAVHPELTAE